MVLALIFLAGCTSQIPQEESFNYKVRFCGDCMDLFLEMLDNSEETYCALYRAADEVIEALEKNNVQTVSDSKIKTNSKTIMKRNFKGLMHNKFCVFDGRTVWTGSWNPYRKEMENDVLIIESKILAENYLREFEELKSGEKTESFAKRMMLGDTEVENYFCPEDECINQLRRKISEADESVYFATYSFTHPIIANELIIKNGQGVTVKGIIEKGTKYTQLPSLKKQGIDVVEDVPKRILHHKMFIIDDETVITGSFNPTRNGDSRNDENFLVIKNKELASKYYKRFEDLRRTALVNS